jgi:hypothetical protein
LPPPIDPGGNAFSGPDWPAFISVEGGIPPLSTGDPLPDDWANVIEEPTDNKPATVNAISFELIMVHLLSKLHT